MSYAVFQPADLMDGISANQLRTEVKDALSNGMKMILIDLKDVTFMNSFHNWFLSRYAKNSERRRWQPVFMLTERTGVNYL